MRDLARSQSKQVQLEMEGDETELDRSLIEAIKDPLTHLVRNAIDHGIESPNQRVLEGKSESGHVVLRAFHEGGMVNIEISDDGAGIDPDRVRQKSLDMGLATRDELQRMSSRQLMQLIFRPGLSTARQLTDISGRGVGMDVVKTNIDRIGGSIGIESRLGRGTKVRIKIPLTLAIIPALIVVCQGDRYAIPQVSLREIIPLNAGDATRGVEIIDKIPVYRLRGELIPIVRLAELLRLPRHEGSGLRPSSQLVVLQAIGRRIGLQVDEIRNTEEIVVKPLHKVLSQLEVFSGATIMGDGRVVLILDAAGMTRRAGIAERAQDASGPPPLPPQTPVSGLGEVLVCRATDMSRVAIPLEDVARLEQRRASDIELASGHEVLPYRGRVMSLVRKQTLAGQNASDDGNVTIVVHAAGDCLVGLVVDSVLDIVRPAEQLDCSQRQPGILGRVLIDSQITEVIDIRELARSIGVHLSNEVCGGVDK